MSGRTVEARFVASVAPTPGSTVAAWGDLAGRVLDLDWGPIVLLAVQHRVEGLLYDALRESGNDDQAPISAMSLLRRRADLAEARQLALFAALHELAGEDPALVSRWTFFKGGVTLGLYDRPGHRMVSDLDFLVHEADAAATADLMARLGYWEKAGRNGPTYFGDVAKRQVGVEFVCFDCHVGMPLKYRRLSGGGDWTADTAPHEIAGVACRRLPLSLEIIECLVHLAEHGASWIHVVLDDDIRLSRVLDVELLCEEAADSGVDVASTADAVNALPQVVLGAAIVRAVRGRLPLLLAPLEALVERVAGAEDLVALPGGETRRWDVPLAERVFLTNRSSLALRMMPPDQRHTGLWFNWKTGLSGGRSEDVAAIFDGAARAIR